MDEVKECKITNEQVRRWFDNIPPVDNFIARRTWNYMVKIMRTKDKSLPRKLLGAWVPSARKPGCPQSNLKDNFIQALKIVLKVRSVTKQCSKNGFQLQQTRKDGTL